MPLRFQIWALVFAIGASLSSLSAQTITHDSPADTEQLSSWLHSNDPRLVAWAATLARERRQSAVIAQLPSWLKDSRVARDYGYAPDRQESRVYDAVLDALIRGGSDAKVEYLTLNALSRVYPIQAFLLLDRLPKDEQLSMLREWFRSSRLGTQYPQLARLAALRLAQWPVPVPGFAARILVEAEEQLTIQVWAAGVSGMRGGTGACGDSLGFPLEPGWPEVYIPVAEDGAQSPTDVSLIALAGEHVDYRWIQENGGWGSCTGFRGLDQRTRQHILEYWLQKSYPTLEFQASRDVSLHFTTALAFHRDLARTIEHEQANFSAIAQVLVHKGLLTREESTWARPQLNLRIVCHTACPIPAATKEPPEGSGFSY